MTSSENKMVSRFLVYTKTRWILRLPLAPLLPKVDQKSTQRLTDPNYSSVAWAVLVPGRTTWYYLPRWCSNFTWKQDTNSSLTRLLPPKWLSWFFSFSNAEHFPITWAHLFRNLFGLVASCTEIFEAQVFPKCCCQMSNSWIKTCIETAGYRVDIPNIGEAAPCSLTHVFIRHYTTSQALTHSGGSLNHNMAYLNYSEAFFQANV